MSDGDENAAMTDLLPSPRETWLLEMLESLKPVDEDPARARGRRAHRVPDNPYPAHDEVDFRIDIDVERASLGAVALAIFEHQTRMAMLGRGEIEPAPGRPAALAPAASTRTAIDLWVMVFSDDNCTNFTGEALYRRTLVDAIPRAGEYLAPGQLKGFSMLRPVVNRVEHAPFPEDSDASTVLLIVHVAATGESDEWRRTRHDQLRAGGWRITLPEPK